MSASGRVRTSAGSGVSAGSCRKRGGVVGSGAAAGHDPELQDLSGGIRVGRVEVPGRRLTGLAAAERLVRSDVAQDVAAHRHVGEVHDQVGALGQPHQQPVVVVGGQVDRGREEAALVADGPDLDAGDLVEVQDQEARLAAVQEAGTGSAAARRSGTARCCR